MQYKYLFLLSILLYISCSLDQLHENIPASAANHEACFKIDTTNLNRIVPVEICFNAACSQNAQSYEWDFNGDGTIDEMGISVCNTFTTVGTFRIVLTTKDNEGNSSSFDNTVTILPATVIPSFSVENDNCTSICQMTFTNTSQNLLGDETFLWDFGNGQTSIARDPNPVEYSSSGTYSVKLSVKPPDMEAIEVSRAVNVLATEAFSYTFNPFSDISHINLVEAINTQDNGYLFLSVSYRSDIFERRSDLVKVNADFSIEKIVPFSSDIVLADVIEVPSGDIFVSGEKDRSLFVKKFTSNLTPDVEYTRDDGSPTNRRNTQLIATSDGNIIAAAEYNKGFAAVKLSSSNLIEIWEEEYEFSTGIFDLASLVTNGNEFFAVGNETQAIVSIRANTESGTMIESPQTYNSFISSNDFEKAGDATLTNNGYAILGTIDGDLTLIETNFNGVELNRQKYPENYTTYGTYIESLADNSYLILGRYTYIQELTTSISFTKTNGNSLLPEFSKSGFDYFPNETEPVTNGVFLKKTLDGGYLLLGTANSELWILKTDAQGNIQ